MQTVATTQPLKLDIGFLDKLSAHEFWASLMLVLTRCSVLSRARGSLLACSSWLALVLARGSPPALGPSTLAAGLWFLPGACGGSSPQRLDSLLFCGLPLACGLLWLVALARDWLLAHRWLLTRSWLVALALLVVGSRLPVFPSPGAT